MVTFRAFLSSFGLVAMLTLGVACNDDSDSSDSDKTDDKTDDSKGDDAVGDDASNGGSCTGAFEDCRMGELSDTQIDAFCTTAFETSGVEPGTKQKCANGQTVTVEDATTCVSNTKEQNACAALADLTARDALDCIVAALKEPCVLVDGNSEACSKFLEAAKDCR